MDKIRPLSAKAASLRARVELADDDFGVVGTFEFRIDVVPALTITEGPTPIKGKSKKPKVRFL
jgi:hypothetical protein